MKNWSISQKVHIPLVASIAIGFVIVLLNYWVSVDQIRENVYAAQSKEMTTVYEEAIEAKKNVGITNAISISKNSAIIGAWPRGTVNRPSRA